MWKVSIMLLIMLQVLAIFFAMLQVLALLIAMVHASEIFIAIFLGNVYCNAAYLSNVYCNIYNFSNIYRIEITMHKTLDCANYHFAWKNYIDSSLLLIDNSEILNPKSNSLRHNIPLLLLMSMFLLLSPLLPLIYLSAEQCLFHLVDVTIIEVFLEK